MDTKRIILGAVALLAILGGALGQRFLLRPQPDAVQESAIPKPALATDAFSIRLFHQQLIEKEQGNILVAPHAVSDALLLLQETSAGKTHEELQAAHLKDGQISRAAEPARATLLAMDFNLPRGGGSQKMVMPLPFSEDLPKALSLYNGMLTSLMGQGEWRLLDSKMVGNRTKLVAGCATSLHPEWDIPFNSANTRTSDFDSASGGMPHFRQMRSRGMFRCAHGEGWRAVALCMKSAEAGETPLVYIGILPDGSARAFAEALSPELLTSIRKALAEATPQDVLVELPRQELRILPYDMRDTLRRMGFKSLFDTQTADFSPLTAEKIHLGAFIHASSISLVESKDAPRPDDELDYAPVCFTFNKPFIWLITDLESSTPIEVIGLTEEM